MIQVFQNLLTKPDATDSSGTADFITVIVMMPSSELTQHLLCARHCSKHFKWTHAFNC